MARPLTAGRGRIWGVGAAVALLTVGLVDTPGASAVTGGSADAGDHPYAVGIIQQGRSSVGCSGVLVHSDHNPDVVLTAAHCFAGSGSSSGRATVVFTSTPAASYRAVPAEFEVDPRYRPHASQLHDIAVLVLLAAPPVAGATLAPVGVLARSPADHVVTVGYGDPYPGQRRQARELVDHVSQDWLYLERGSGNSCNGDSGGPDLLPGGSVVVALTDQGSCANSQDLRLDTPGAHSFIDATAGALHAALARDRITLGQSTVLRAALSDRAAGRTALRQGYYAGAWHTWSQHVVRRDGTVSFTITPSHRATDRYRVYLPATRTAPAAASRTCELVVS